MLKKLIKEEEFTKRDEFFLSNNAVMWVKGACNVRALYEADKAKFSV